MTANISRHWWWRPGWQPGSRLYTFHFTFARQPAVQELAADARARLAGFSWLDPVPGQWLHCTTQGIGFAGDVTEIDLSAIAAAARARLAAVPPAAVTITAPHAAGEGALCDVIADGSLDVARDAARAAIADIWGPARVLEGAALGLVGRKDCAPRRKRQSRTAAPLTRRLTLTQGEAA